MFSSLSFEASSNSNLGLWFKKIIINIIMCVFFLIPHHRAFSLSLSCSFGWILVCVNT